jgi:asparagine synthase (glutamine-hydrolysing)
MRDINIGQMFNTSFLEHMKEGPRESLQDSCGAASEVLSAPDLCIYYYITERIRRQVVASLDIFRTEIEVRMPYVDEQFIRALLKLPVQNRNRGEIQFALVKRCMPELIAIPDSNTGAPLDAGPLRLLVTDKFNSLMKRLSVKGFRHYTEFHKWHRERFKENTERIIFSEKAADRGIYNQDHLRSVFNLHISGEKNYGQLLGTVVGLELWFRTFVE